MFSIVVFSSSLLSCIECTLWYLVSQVFSSQVLCSQALPVQFFIFPSSLFSNCVFSISMVSGSLCSSPLPVRPSLRRQANLTRLTILFSTGHQHLDSHLLVCLDGQTTEISNLFLLSSPPSVDPLMEYVEFPLIGQGVVAWISGLRP